MTDGTRPMTPERWAQIRSAAQDALALPARERAAFLDRVCQGDTGLRAEVEAQVEACERAAQSPDFLASPAALYAAPFFASDTGIDGASESNVRRATRPEQQVDVQATLSAALTREYDIERELGRGGTARVYLARDRRHAREVAIKVLDPALGAAMSAGRFLREIRLAAGFTHPHILPLHDSGEAAGLLYYVMPYVDGESLRERLAREGALPIDAVTRLMREVTSALAYAHRRNVVHRDIKPANILFEESHAVVADFGIARALRQARESNDGEEGDQLASGPLTATGVSLGTPAYMAPEQALGDGEVDHRSDLYSLGVVAYQALAGRHPFAGRSRIEMVTAHLSQQPEPLGSLRSDIPAALGELVMRLLAKNPSDRPQSAEEVLRALDGAAASPAPSSASPNALRDVPSPAPSMASTPTTDGGIVGRKQRPVWAAIAAVAVVLGVGSYKALHGHVPSAITIPGATTGSRARATVSPAAIKTVAVLPFESLGGAAGDDYFGDGLTDELAHALARLPGMRVAGRSSSRAFKGKDLPAQEIGRALDVSAIVGGSVRRAGDRLRVSAQLVSTADGTVMWDSVYETKSGDVFAVQDDFTRSIVAALTPQLGGRATDQPAKSARGTADQEAYDLYLKGRYYWIQRGSANLSRSIGYFQQAIARDPKFARAHAGLALAYSLMPIYLPDAADSAAELTRVTAEHAVSLDSSVADGQLALGLAFEMQLQFRAALAHYRKAIALEPSNVTAHHWFGFSLLSFGHTDEALTELRRAATLDPMSPSPASAVSTALLFARRFPESITAARHALTLDSTFAFATWTLALAQAFGGQPDSAVRTLEQGVRQHPNHPLLLSALLFSYAAADRWGDAEKMRTQLRASSSGKDDSGIQAPFAELVFGDRDPMVRQLTTEDGQRRYVAVGTAFGCNPLLDPLWSDPRFANAMRTLGVKTCGLAQPWPIHPPH